MIQIMASKWAPNPPILRDGHEFGTLIRGLAYVQGATARELRETADRMDADAPSIENPDAKAAHDCAQCVIDIAQMYAKGVYSESAFLSAMARHGDKLRMIAEGST